MSFALLETKTISALSAAPHQRRNAATEWAANLQLPVERRKSGRWGPRVSRFNYAHLELELFFSDKLARVECYKLLRPKNMQPAWRWSNNFGAAAVWLWLSQADARVGPACQPMQAALGWDPPD
jgi:hypothetical protein